MPGQLGTRGYQVPKKNKTHTDANTNVPRDSSAYGPPHFLSSWYPGSRVQMYLVRFAHIFVWDHCSSYCRRSNFITDTIQSRDTLYAYPDTGVLNASYAYPGTEFAKNKKMMLFFPRNMGMSISTYENTDTMV
jgi:hypothetical protein